MSRRVPLSRYPQPVRETKKRTQIGPYAVPSAILTPPPVPASPDESHFVDAATEYDAGRARPGLVVRAEAEADGDPARTRAGYIRARATELADANVSKRLPTWLAFLAVATIVIIVLGVSAIMNRIEAEDEGPVYSLPISTAEPVPAPVPQLPAPDVQAQQTEAEGSDMYASPNAPQRAADEAFRTSQASGATREDAEAAAGAAYHDSYWGDTEPYVYDSAAVGM